MDAREIAAEIAALYPTIYQRLHSRWQKNEARPSAEALAILTHLERSGPLTVTEAARHFDRAQSAMSELIDRLQTHGWVDRVADGRDRRRTLVWLTEAGIALLQRSRAVLDVVSLARCIDRMDPQDRLRLYEGLRALVRASEDFSLNLNNGDPHD